MPVQEENGQTTRSGRCICQDPCTTRPGYKCTRCVCSLGTWWAAPNASAKDLQGWTSRMVSAWKPQSRNMEREEPRSWLVDKQNLCEAQLPQQLRVPTALGSSAVT